MTENSVCIRPYLPDDMEGVVRLLNRELHADPISSQDFRRKVLMDANFRPEGALVAEWEDRVVGFMLGIHRSHPLEDATPDFDRGWITLMAVDRSYQRRGIGSRLLTKCTEYLKTGWVESVLVSPYAPNYFLPGVDETAYPGAVEFLSKHGFEVAYRPLSMEASLAFLEIPMWVREKESLLLSTGVSVSTLSPQRIPLLLDFLKHEFPGDWQRVIREDVSCLPESTPEEGQILLAMDGEEVVGFCRFQGERFGPFGVAVSQRGRGIGAVLLARCLTDMRASGAERAWFMWTSDDAARLYSEFGFRETRRFSVMRKRL